MIRLAIVVEGETEEEFVKRVLAAHLRAGGGTVPYPASREGRQHQRRPSRARNGEFVSEL